GIGTAVEIALPGGLAGAAAAVRDALTEIRPASDGAGPVAVGAFPFAAGRPARLVVPRRTLRRHGPGPTWDVRVGPVDDPSEPGAVRRLGPAGPGVGELRVRPIPAPQRY